jgi:hypothetical protein
MSLIKIDPTKSAQYQIAAYEAALDKHLDSVAQADRWSDRFTFAARAAYPNPWQQKAIAFGTWMDNCNAVAYNFMQKITSGELELCPVEDFLKLLPVFEYNT